VTSTISTLFFFSLLLGFFFFSQPQRAQKGYKISLMILSGGVGSPPHPYVFFGGGTCLKWG